MKLATVFSGIGAIEHALEKSNINYEIVFASDKDKYCKQSYFANYKIDESRWYDDIKKIDGKKYLHNVDLFVGGSPCQSFSVIGKKRGFEDERGNLFFEFIRLVNEIKPKVFIFENVKGLLKKDTFKIVEDAFKSTGYTYYKQVLNAKDYEIPQNRQRLFIVGFLNNTDFKFPPTIPLTLKVNDFLLKEIEEKYYLSEKMVKHIFYDRKNNHILNKNTDKEVTHTILATCSKMHRSTEDNYISTPKIRRLTPRECLRLMGFSDDFKIVVSDAQMYKQAGNSIVVNVLINILKSVYDYSTNGQLIII
jgi:DNA (cytosine-5)-methyltransferase 1